jgi:tRNA pseudouridine(38-40) synthase
MNAKAIEHNAMDNTNQSNAVEFDNQRPRQQFRLNGWDTNLRFLVGRMEGWKRKAMFYKKQVELRKVGLTILDHGHGFWAQQESALEVAKYRLNEADRAKINNMLSYYKGTHKYHNFTNGKRPDDMSCQRYMMSFTCSKPFLIHGIEFVQLQVVGQSFMLHQIRKMVGLIVHLMRRNVEKEEDLKNIFASAFSAHQWGISAVPPDGLFLERLFFDGYNRKAERMNNGNSSDNKFNIAKRDGLTFDSPKVLTLLEDFKRQYIHRHIAQRIILYRPFTCWLNTQGNHYLPLPHDTQDEKVAIERKKSGGKGKSRKRNDNGGRRPWKNKPNKKQRKQ